MRGDAHVWICESLGMRFPPATRLPPGRAIILPEQYANPPIRHELRPWHLLPFGFRQRFHDLEWFHANANNAYQKPERICRVVHRFHCVAVGVVNDAAYSAESRGAVRSYAWPRC